MTRSTMRGQPSLRLFDGTAARDVARERMTRAEGQALSDEMSLADYYEAAFLRRYLEFYGLTHDTRLIYDNAVNWWVKLTDDPPLWRIDDDVIDDFIAELAKQPGRKGEKMAAASVHRVLRSLDTILATTGPRSRRNKRGQNVLASPPFIEKPKLERGAVKPRFSVEELRTLYAAAGSMRTPRKCRTGLAPAAFWKLTLALFYYTGFRKTETLMLTWQDVRERDGGRFLLLPKAIRKGRVEDHCKWIHPDLSAMLVVAENRARREAGYPKVAVLPWPHDERYLERCFKMLCERAGVRPTRKQLRDEGRRADDLAFHAVRRTHLNLFYRSRFVQLREQALAETQQSAGHAELATTIGHYVEEDPVEVAAQLQAAIAVLPSIV